MSFHNTNGETLIKASTFHESDVSVGLVTLHMDFTHDYNNYLLKIAQTNNDLCALLFAINIII